ncbi:hypothetical protein ACJ41O_004520 [Fusarium nematophilum]
MSFLTENIVRRVALAPRVFAIQAPRTFSTSFAAHRTATEAVKDTAKKVDRAVSDKIVDGIEVGETVTGKIKEGAEQVTGSHAASKAAELKGEAKGKASELQGEAKGAAKEAKGKVKGATEELKNKL